MLDKETENKLLKEAIDKYPIGTVFKSPFYAKNRFRVTKEYYNPRFHNDGTSIIISETGAVYDVKNDIWAEIISYPEEYVPDKESKINNNYQLY